jgi:hypothetical protein
MKEYATKSILHVGAPKSVGMMVKFCLDPIACIKPNRGLCRIDQNLCRGHARVQINDDNVKDQVGLGWEGHKINKATEWFGILNIVEL